MYVVEWLIVAKEGDFIYASQNLPQQFSFGIHQLSVGNKETMEKAMEAVKSGVGINKAPMECGVPLVDMWIMALIHVPYLNKEEEKKLAIFLKSASIGYGKTRKQVMAIVEAYFTNYKKGLGSSKITQGWWRRKFLERQKICHLRRCDNTSQDRMDATNSEILEHYFALLKKILEENDLTTVLYCG